MIEGYGDGIVKGVVAAMVMVALASIVITALIFSRINRHYGNDTLVGGCYVDIDNAQYVLIGEDSDSVNMLRVDDGSNELNVYGLEGVNYGFESVDSSLGESGGSIRAFRSGGMNYVEMGCGGS
jgi:hypothetical protein